MFNNKSYFSIAFQVNGGQVAIYDCVGSTNQVTEDMLMELAVSGNIRNFIEVYLKRMGHVNLPVGPILETRRKECPCQGACEKLRGSFRVSAMDDAATFTGYIQRTCHQEEHVDKKYYMHEKIEIAPSAPLLPRILNQNKQQAPAAESRKRKHSRVDRTLRKNSVMALPIRRRLFDDAAPDRQPKRAKREETQELDIRRWWRGGWMGVLARWMAGVGGAESKGLAWR